MATPIDCREHAALSYCQLDAEISRGAYDVMFSWITVCPPDITKAGHVRYTLIEEEDLEILAPDLHRATLDAFASAVRTVALHDDVIRRFTKERAPQLLA